jgi:erythritol kinase
MNACIADWVSPLLGEAEAPDAGLARVYAGLYPPYRQAREALVPVWHALKSSQETASAQ